MIAVGILVMLAMVGAVIYWGISTFQRKWGDEREIKAFAAWLETVSPRDFGTPDEREHTRER